MKSGIDYSPLQKALATLEEAIQACAAAPEIQLLRDGAIQRFEYCYELSWKLLKRHLEAMVPEPSEVDGWSYQQLIREGAERGLIQDARQWMEFRKLRNQTAHAYEPAIAAQVFSQLPLFLGQSRHLLAQMRLRAA